MTDDTSEHAPIGPGHQLAAPRPSHKIAIVLCILLLLAIVLAVVLFLHHREEAKKKAAALALPKPGIAVTIATAQKGSIGIYLDGIGTVTPEYTVSIYTQVDGVVVAVHYTEGQLVNKGDPLIDIDSRPYRATLLQAQGALERDENVLAQALSLIHI